jgi:hypothetical protein
MSDQWVARTVRIIAEGFTGGGRGQVSTTGSRFACPTEFGMSITEQMGQPIKGYCRFPVASRFYNSFACLSEQSSKVYLPSRNSPIKIGIFF